MTPLDPPPPAYVSEHDYDRKISDVLQRSLTISQPLTGDDEWEEWDEAKFQAAAATARGGFPNHTRPSSEKESLARQDALYPEHTSGEASSSSSPPTVNPPNRRLPASPPTKEEPSWLAEAQLTPAELTSGRNSQGSTQVHLPAEEEDPDEPLPPFAAIGPSLEGPPFEDVVRETRRLPQGRDTDSPPESPLDSVADSDILPELPLFTPPSDRRSSYGDHSNRVTSPRQPTSPHIIRTSPVSSSSHRPPSMRFDPSVAYTKPRALDTFPNDDDSKPPVDAYAFYNSAVSSFMGQPQPPKKRVVPLKRDTPASSSPYDSSIARDPYSQVSQIPLVTPPMSPPLPAQNPHYPTQHHAYIPNQYPPYSQPQLQQQASIPYQGYAQGAPPGPPTHWQSSSNMYGGGPM